MASLTACMTRSVGCTRIAADVKCCHESPSTATATASRPHRPGRRTLHVAAARQQSASTAACVDVVANETSLAVSRANTGGTGAALGARGSVPRRHMVGIMASFVPLIAAARAGAEGTAVAAFDQYVDAANDFVFSKPANWERTEKSGATVLYVDPARKSTTLGVVVNPVRIQSLVQFGTLAEVSKRLQDAEREKDGFLDIQVLREAERTASCGAVMYEYVYKLDSSRGLKSIYNVVCITNRKLYIYTLTIKEAKKEEEQAIVQQTKGIADKLVASFDIGAKPDAALAENAGGRR